MYQSRSLVGLIIVLAVIPYVLSVSSEMRQALPVHVALEQGALVRPTRACLHFINDAEPITVVNLRNEAG